MSQWVEAIFENGAFRPQSPVNFAEGERVSLQVQAGRLEADDLSDIRDLLDFEFVEHCLKNTTDVPTLEEVRSILAEFRGSLADRINEERDEH